MAWNDGGNGKDPWDKEREEPIELDRIVQGWQRKLAGVVGGGRGGGSQSAASSYLLIIVLLVVDGTSVVAPVEDNGVPMTSTKPNPAAQQDEPTAL